MQNKITYIFLTILFIIIIFICIYNYNDSSVLRIESFKDNDNDNNNNNFLDYMIIPLYKPVKPSFLITFVKQSIEFLYKSSPDDADR